MGVSINSSSRSQNGLRRRPRAMSEINVTPFVDVMLVLLIIFMVTAPLMTVGVPVDLPEVDAGTVNEKTEPLVVSISPQGEIFLQETTVSLEALAPRLKAIALENTKTRIFIRGDRTISYGKMMQVMGTITAAGFEKVALLTEMPKYAGNTRQKSRQS
ncbi:MAG: protein TolR [Pseudomonadota bacterium]